MASDTHILAGDEDNMNMDTEKHSHAHLHSEANPFNTAEVRCSQIRRGCGNNIHVIKSPELFLYTETTKLCQDLKGSKGSFWHTVKGCFSVSTAGGVY